MFTGKNEFEAKNNYLQVISNKFYNSSLVLHLLNHLLESAPEEHGHVDVAFCTVFHTVCALVVELGARSPGIAQVPASTS